MNATEWAAWEAKRAREADAARGLLYEADGWASGVDRDDDEAMLAWARHYLPRVRAWAAETDRP